MKKKVPTLVCCSFIVRAFKVSSLRTKAGIWENSNFTEVSTGNKDIYSRRSKVFELDFMEKDGSNLSIKNRNTTFLENRGYIRSIHKFTSTQQYSSS